MIINNAIYLGTFDPITLGHVDVIKKASNIFNNVIVVVANNHTKNTIFSIDERISMIQNDINFYKISNVNVIKSGSTVYDTLKSIDSPVTIVRGVRNNHDFENEFRQANINKTLYNLETVFIPATGEYQFISSSTVKRILDLGGSIDNFVSKNTKSLLYSKLNKAN